MRRVPEVIDVWFDSGSMPFAQRHAPFENEEQFRATFPADYICEAIDQTRGWFYSLLAISTLLFDRAPYRTVLCLGHIADPQGKKMSKSLGNIVVPWDVIERHGADAFRWYFLTSKQPWDGYLFSTETVGESRAPVPAPALEHVRLLRALRERQRRSTAPGEPETELDRWAISRLDATIAEVARADGGLRRDARRPGDRGVRRRALELVRAALAPALLGRRPGRVRDAAHLPGRGRQAARAVLPVRRRRDLREPRRQPRRACTCADFPAGRRARPRARVGDGASRARPCGSGWRRAGTASSRCASRCARPSSSRRATSARRSSARGRPCARSSTSRSCASSREADELGSYEVKPNYRSLGPRFGKQMPQVAAAVAALDPAHVAAALRDGGARRRSASTATTTSSARDDLQLAMQPLEGYQLEREGSHAVALDLAARRGAAARGPRARDRPRGPERAQGAGPAGRGPDRAGARRRRGAARRRARPRGLPRARRRSRVTRRLRRRLGGTEATIDGRRAA